MRPISIRRRHGAQGQPLAGGKLLARALELSAGGEDVAAARRPTRRRIAGVEDHLRKPLDLLPLEAFETAAGPAGEPDRTDLGGNALQEPPERFRVRDRFVD